MKKKEEDKEWLRGKIVEPEDTPPPVENVVVTEMEGEENVEQTEEGEQAGVDKEDKAVAPSDDDYVRNICDSSGLYNISL